MAKPSVLSKACQASIGLYNGLIFLRVYSISIREPDMNPLFHEVEMADPAELMNRLALRAARAPAVGRHVRCSSVICVIV